MKPQSKVVIVSLSHPVELVAVRICHTAEQVRDARKQGWFTLTEIRSMPTRLTDAQDLARSLQRTIENQRARIEELEERLRRGK